MERSNTVIKQTGLALLFQQCSQTPPPRGLRHCSETTATSILSLNSRLPEWNQMLGSSGERYQSYQGAKCLSSYAQADEFEATTSPSHKTRDSAVVFISFVIGFTLKFISSCMPTHLTNNSPALHEWGRQGGAVSESENGGLPRVLLGVALQDSHPAPRWDPQ